MQDIKTEAVNEEKLDSTERSEISSDIQQEVQEIKEAVAEVVSETSLPDKVETLRSNIESLSEEMQSWRTWRKNTSIEALETLNSQVSEIQDEWATVSGSMKSQYEKLEAALQSFPGVIEASTLKALSLRVTHLERLVSQLLQESEAKSSAAGAKKQLIISLTALGVTIVLWAIWIGLTLIK
jgi:Zn-dependent M32 family carboxypeptidase